MKYSISKIGSEIYHRAAHALYRFKSRKAKFVDIYQRNGFRGQESKSGPGSSLKQTTVIRRELPALCRELNIRSLLDAPCGDFHWMKELDMDIEQYIGADIVPDIIRTNTMLYNNSKRQFMAMDITKDPLPTVDLILCRDCFIHLSFEDISLVLRNISRSRSLYLLTTTFTEVENNRDIVTGRVRYIDLRKPPFNFPEPIRLINEECTEMDRKCSDKCLGLWKLDTIKL